MNSDFPKNVVNSTGEPLHVGHERIFLLRFFQALEKQMGEEFRRLTFVVHFWSFTERTSGKINLYKGDSNHILILIGDERNIFPVGDYFAYKMIFRAYGNPKGGDTRIHPFPIGYFNQSGVEEIKNFDERNISVFFSGYLNRNRIDLYKQFNRIWWLPIRNLTNCYTKEIARRLVERFYRERDFNDLISNSIIKFTEWFGKGLSPDVYAKTLSFSKIVICPAGFVTGETIRHWEALRHGCVLISAPLPPVHFYKDSPIIQLDDWSKLMPLLNELLSDPSRLKALHQKSLDWWTSHCSEEAVAEFMIKSILSENSW